MSRNIFGRLIATAAANVVPAALGIIVTPLLAREFGPAGRGEFAALTITIIVVGVLGTGGVQDAFNYYVASGRLGVRRAMRLMWLTSLPMSAIAVAALLVLSSTVLREPEAVRTGIVWLALLMPVHVQFNMLCGIVMGRGDLRTTNLVIVAQAIVRTIITVGGCLALDLSPFWAAAIFVGVYLLGHVYMYVRLISAPADSEEKLDTRSVLAFGGRSIPALIASMSALRLNQILGLALIGPAELGLYAAAVSIAELPMIVAVAGRSVLIANPKTTKDPRAALPIIRWALLAGVLGCAAIAVAAPAGVPLYLGSDFSGATNPVIILAFGVVLATVATLMSALLMMSGMPGRQSRASIAGALVGVVAVIPLAGAGASGAAWAVVAGHAVAAILAMLDVRRFLGLPLTAIFGLARRQNLHPSPQPTVSDEVPSHQ